METKDLVKLLATLADSRPIFHSECDFQHELAMLLRQKLCPKALRLERPYSIGNRKFELDIFLQTTERVGIELKYKTRKLDTVIHGETYNLKQQAALGSARFDYLVDIERLESLKRENYIDKGFAILLTNESALYSEDFSGGSERYEPLYINENITISGSPFWGGIVTEKSVGRNRMKPIELTGTYKMNWRDYSIENPNSKHRIFRYLVTEAC